MRNKLGAIAAGLAAVLATAALPTGAAAHATHHHKSHPRHRRIAQPPATMPQSGVKVLQHPVWGRQGHLPTLRPSSSATGLAVVGADADDPVQSGCWDANAYIAATAPFPVQGQQMGYVANWYSPDCGTNWAETVLTNDPGFSGEFLYAQITDPATGEEHDYSSYANGTYTDMTQSADSVACAAGGLYANGTAFGTYNPGACA